MGGPLSAVTDRVSGVAFAALHAFDDCGVQDAAKNLRVLWTRALLANNGLLKDDIAFELLPPSTRGIVSESMAPVWESLLPFCDWIKARTEYLDSILNTFLSARPADATEPYQVVVIGAGYDTRSLRLQGDHVEFFEVDLPEVVSGKDRLYQKYIADHPDRSRLPTSVPMDLNDCRDTNIVELLKAKGLKAGRPTAFVFEAVMFYLDEDAVQGLFKAIYDFSETSETVITMTDSLKGLGVTKPFLPDVKPVFEENNFQLLTHRAQWGGAVHFTSFVSTSTPESETLRDHMVGQLGKPVNSYAPQFSRNSGTLLKNPSFRKTWCVVLCLCTILVSLSHPPSCVAVASTLLCRCRIHPLPGLV